MDGRYSGVVGIRGLLVSIAGRKPAKQNFRLCALSSCQVSGCSEAQSVNSVLSKPVLYFMPLLSHSLFIMCFHG